MSKKLFFALLGFFVSHFANALETFTCGNAKVTLEVIKVDGNKYEFDTALTVHLKNISTILRYTNIDYIGGICVKDAKGQNRIVYQAYCGGSGCKDLDNWGIIDPKNLQVLLVPNDYNRDEAKNILGTELPNVKFVLSIGKELDRLGIPAI